MLGSYEDVNFLGAQRKNNQYGSIRYFEIHSNYYFLNAIHNYQKQQQEDYNHQLIQNHLQQQQINEELFSQLNKSEQSSENRTIPLHKVSPFIYISEQSSSLGQILDYSLPISPISPISSSLGDYPSSFRPPTPRTPILNGSETNLSPSPYHNISSSANSTPPSRPITPSSPVFFNNFINQNSLFEAPTAENIPQYNDTQINQDLSQDFSFSQNSLESSSRNSSRNPLFLLQVSSQNLVEITSENNNFIDISNPSTAITNTLAKESTYKNQEDNFVTDKYSKNIKKNIRKRVFRRKRPRLVESGTESSTDSDDNPAVKRRMPNRNLFLIRKN